jgi:hypothetical protein
MANSLIGAGVSATHFTCADTGGIQRQTASIKFVVWEMDFTYSGSFPNKAWAGPGRAVCFSRSLSWSLQIVVGRQHETRADIE